MTRTQVREEILRFLYLLDFQPDERDAQEALFLEDKDMSAEELLFFRTCVSGVLEHRIDLDREISPELVDWRFERLPILDKNILRLALYEMDYCPDTPPSVAISEAVKLAKSYCDDKAPAYINAVLATLNRKREES